MKKTFIFITIFVLMSSLIFARDLDPNTSDSPANDSTAGRFGSDFDNFLDVTEWNSLNDNVLFLQFDSPENSSTDYSNQFQAGSGYFLNNGLYLGGFIGLSLPQEAGYDSSEIVDNTELFVDSDGNITAKQSVIETETDFNNYQYIDGSVLVGLMLGDMPLGIAASFTSDKDTVIGTFDPTLNWTSSGATTTDPLAAGTLPVNVNQTIQTSSVTEVENATGTLTYKSVDKYGEGYANDEMLGAGINLGLVVPLNGSEIKAALDSSIGLYNNDEFAEHTVYTTSFDGVSPDYAGVTSPTEYDYYKAEITDSYTELDFSLAADYIMPISEVVSLSLGAAYNPIFKLYGDGKEYSGTRVNYDIAYTDEYYETTEIVRTIERSDDISDTQHTISLQLGIEVEPSDQFHFALGYTPKLTLHSMETKYSGTVIQTTTTQDTDPTTQDSVVTVTDKYQNVTETEESASMNHVFDIGSQFYLRDNFRINLGAEVSIYSFNETETNIDYDDQTSTTTTEQTGDETTSVTTAYSYEQDLDANNSDENALTKTATRNDINYNAGFTFFFSEDMYLDFAYQQDTYHNIWSLDCWTFMMTILY